MAFNESYDLLVRRLLLERSSDRRGRVPKRRPPPPMAQAERYAADLRRLVNEVEVLILRRLALTPHVDRYDASVVDIIGQLIDEVTVLFEREVRVYSERAAGDVNRVSLETVEEQWQEVLGVGYPRRGSTLRDHLEGFRDRNVELITGMGREQLNDIKRALRELGPGAHSTDIAKVLRERIGVTRSRASLIARDQVLKLNSQLTQLRHEEAGIEDYEWSAVMDERTRQSTNKSLDSYSKYQDHRRLNGKKFKWSEPPVVNTKTGDRAHPGEYFQCRCVPLPVFQ